jgi:glycosyltransferase involved in cell wall biosynthesis
MKILVCPGDLHGCGYYRLIWPAMVLQAQGHDIDIVNPEDRNAMFAAEIDEDTRELTGGHVKFPRQYDVIVMQRITHKYLAQIIPYIRAEGTAVVIDVDDDLHNISQSNPMYLPLHPKKRPGSLSADHSWEWARIACDNATMVQATTPALLDRYARRTTGRLIPNYVPENALDVDHDDSRIFGWGGGLHSHAEDAPIVSNTVQRLVNEGHHFRIIGPNIGVKRAFHLEDGQFDATGPIDLAYWIAALGMLGVGMAPLASTTFNRAKSWLKPMEYAAAGVPSVVSPSPAYRELHDKHGIGDIAEKPKDWYRLVRRLITDDAYRIDRGAESRAAASDLTIEKHAWRWMEAWSEALAIQRQ